MRIAAGAERFQECSERRDVELAALEVIEQKIQLGIRAELPRFLECFVANEGAEGSWSTEKLQQARAYAETINTAAVMIVQSGIVVDAWGETTRKFNVHSVRKSLLSAMIGIYENHGTLRLRPCARNAISC